MSRKRFRSVAALVLVASLFSGLTGCMFKMRHEMPLNAYFNEESRDGSRRHFEDEAMKNWALAGLVPYSDFGAKDLVQVRPGREVSSLSIETVFTGIDTLIWFIPGFAYGYYLWAPRHVKVEGEYVEEGAPVLRPTATPAPAAGRRALVTR